VVSEAYLGEPLSSQPSPTQLQLHIKQSRTLISAFLKNLQPQLSPGTPLVLAVPAWRQGSQFTPSLTLDDLEDLGYTGRDFVNIDARDLIYARDDQIVGRKILVFNRN